MQGDLFSFEDLHQSKPVIKKKKFFVTSGLLTDFIIFTFDCPSYLFHLIDENEIKNFLIRNGQMNERKADSLISLCRENEKYFVYHKISEYDYIF